MSSTGSLRGFHIPHLATGDTPGIRLDRACIESSPAAENSTSNRLVAPGKRTEKKNNGSIRTHMKRKAKCMKKDSLEADGELVLFPGRDESYPEELNRLIGPLNCQLCKVQMTSRKRARDHYESKAHDRHISAWLVKNYTEVGLEAPSDGRHGIGSLFLKAEGLTKDSPTDVLLSENSAIKRTCNLCKIMVTSAAQMQAHLAGARHQKNFRTSGQDQDQPEDVRLPEASISETKKLDAAELALYRTPMGQYYCQTCDMMMNHETILQQHFIGKKHLKRIKNLSQTEKTV